MLRELIPVVSCAIIATTATPGVMNGSFEEDIRFDPDNAPGNEGEWFVFSGGGLVLNQVATMPSDGMRHIEMIAEPGQANGFVGAFQDVVGIVAGEVYNFSMDLKYVGDPLLDVVEMRIEWRDADGNTIPPARGNQIDLTAAELSDSYQTFSVIDDAPDEAAVGRLVFALQTFDGGGEGSEIFGDNVTFIPSPAGFALLAMGGMAASRRRRA